MIIGCEPHQGWSLLEIQVEVSTGQLDVGPGVAEAVDWGAEPAEW